VLLFTQLSADDYLFRAAMLEHLPAAVFLFVFGACVGSFLNVVVYRLPRNMRLLIPPSRCTSCDHRLRFFRENLPILGWIASRGRCRYCGERISIEYPVIEATVACMFLLVYALAYWIPTGTPFFGEVFGQWWHANGLARSLPMYIALMGLLCGLLAMTLIDARTFTIPIQIPIVVTFIALVCSVWQSLIDTAHTTAQTWPMPGVDWTWAGAAIGGWIGVLLSTLLLRAGIFKPSFADYEDFVDEGEVLGEYPHARREVLRECVFLLPAVIGFAAGWMLGYEGGAPPLAMQAIGGSLLGYLVGGGLVWAIRILGTFAFGREAMGLGDVHLLGCVGAVLGWWDPILIFFIAPFSGLLWAAVSAALASALHRPRREIPYGPHLAVAAAAVIFLHPWVMDGWRILLPGTSLPGDGLVESQDSGEIERRDDWTSGAMFDSMRVVIVAARSGRAGHEVPPDHDPWSSETEKGHA
jgi:leader peptidase (prepilin peptidase)/N-methyltransferase